MTPKVNFGTLQSNVLYIHWLPPQEVQILIRFDLRLAVSKIQHVQGRWKSEMHRMNQNWNWTLNSQKFSIYTKIHTPEAQALVRFTLRLATFRDTTCTWSAKRSGCTEWPQTELEHLTVKSVYTKDLPMRSKFWSVSLYDQRFPGYCTFCNYKLTTMLNVQKRTKKKITKNPKFEMLHSILYTTLVRSFLGACMNFGEPIWRWFS